MAAPVVRLGTRRLDDERYERVLRRGTKIVAVRAGSDRLRED